MNHVERFIVAVMVLCLGSQVGWARENESRAPLDSMSSSELTAALVKHITSGKPAPFGRAVLPTKAGGVVALRVWVNYTIKGLSGTVLSDLTSYQYVENEATGEKVNSTPVYTHPKIDLSDLKKAELMEPMDAGGRLVYGVSLKLGTPIIFRLYVKGQVQEKSMDGTLLSFAEKKDAIVAKELADAIIAAVAREKTAAMQAELLDLQDIASCKGLFVFLRGKHGIYEAPAEILQGVVEKDWRNHLVDGVDAYLEIRGSRYAGLAGQFFEIWELRKIRPTPLDETLRKLVDGNATELKEKDLLRVISYIQRNKRNEAADALELALLGPRTMFASSRNPASWPKGFCGLVYSTVLGK